jgi:hypothetical protein
MDNNIIAIKVDASIFEKKIGDSIKSGEILGDYGGSSIKAPFDGIVKGITFEPEDHGLIILLEKHK